MDITRRDFLKVVGLLAGTAAGCVPLAQYIPGEDKAFSDPYQVTQLEWLALNRLSFGPGLMERQRILDIGLANYIEEGLFPQSIEDIKSDLLISRFDVLDLDADALRNRGDKLFDNFDPDLVLDDFRRATLLRQIYSRRQLLEVMVEFWTDHFNISVQKGDCWFLKVVDDREVIRAHALGNFRELLGASAHSPAMLVYLDNQENHKDAPNENYARELLELHSLGVDGGYTQDDVMELARCLTGWKVKEHFWRGQVTFDADAHTPGSKTVLGKSIPPAGKGEIDQVLNLLVDHPATARAITSKLARRFLADAPPPEVIDAGVNAFLKTKGEIKAVLKVILLDGFQVLSKENHPLKYKRPLNYLLSAIRQTGADTNGGVDLQRYLARMGQPLFDWPTPDGYPDRSIAWQGNLLPRWKFALDLVQNRIKGTRFDLAPFLEGIDSDEPRIFVERACSQLLGCGLPTKTQDDLLALLKPTIKDNPHQAAEVVIAGILASPAFQWR
jgi:hypothetical protein